MTSITHLSISPFAHKWLISQLNGKTIEQLKISEKAQISRAALQVESQEKKKHIKTALLVSLIGLVLLSASFIVISSGMIDLHLSQAAPYVLGGECILASILYLAKSKIRKLGQKCFPHLYNARSMQNIAQSLIKKTASSPQIPSLSSCKNPFLKYEDLPFFDIEKQSVEKVITLIDETSFITLALDLKRELSGSPSSYHLHRDLMIVQQSHPLKVLEHIICTPHIKKHMENILFGTFGTFTKKAIFKGTKENLEIYHKKNSILCYIEDFAEKIKIAPEKLTISIHNENWDEFINTLITHSTKKT